MTHFTTVSVWRPDVDTCIDVGSYVGFGKSSQDATLNAMRNGLGQLITDDDGVQLDLSYMTFSELVENAERCNVRFEPQIMGTVPQ